MTVSWWHCYNDIEKNDRIDVLCQQGLAQGYRVTALATPEQLISNLTVLENIELPGIWHGYAAATNHDPLSGAITDCLQRCLRTHQSMDQFLHTQGAKLNSHQRRWVGLARALYIRANWIVIDDDEKNIYPFEDERLLVIADYLPDATAHWVSLRAPSTLPDNWLFAESGVNT